jgi:hypothetical protein
LLNFIELVIGYRDPEKRRGKQTRIRATEKLQPFLQRIGQVTIEWGELIRLKDEKKTLVDFKDTAHTREMRAFVAAYNLFLQNADICLSDSGLLALEEAGEDAFFDEKFVYRLFLDGRFDRLGRYHYPWWQKIPSEIRPHILIDGEQTAEHDFNSPQVHCLYGMKGLAFTEGDPYILPGFEDRREDVKAVFTRSVNVNSEERFVRSCRKKGIEDGPSLVNTFYDFHSAIFDFKFMEMGKELMFMESEVATLVMERCMIDDVIVLGVHDSFIAQEHVDLPSLMIWACAEKGWISIPEIKTILPYN